MYKKFPNNNIRDLKKKKDKPREKVTTSIAIQARNRAKIVSQARCRYTELVLQTDQSPSFPYSERHIEYALSTLQTIHAISRRERKRVCEDSVSPAQLHSEREHQGTIFTNKKQKCLAMMAKSVELRSVWGNRAQSANQAVSWLLLILVTRGAAFPFKWISRILTRWRCQERCFECQCHSRG